YGVGAARDTHQPRQWRLVIRGDMAIIHRCIWYLPITCGVLMWATATAEPPQPLAVSYKSPYSVKLTHPLAELIGDLENGARGHPQEESALPFGEWYSPRTEK